jgi:hypothetical protein
VNCSPHDEHRQSERGVISLASVPTILEPRDGQSGRDESCGAMESSLVRGVAVSLDQSRVADLRRNGGSSDFNEKRIPVETDTYSSRLTIRLSHRDGLTRNGHRPSPHAAAGERGGISSNG